MKICPQPTVWFSVFKRLEEFAHTKPCKPPKPPFPLVLNGWVFSNDVQRRERWETTVAWAEVNGCPELVTDIAENDFYCVEKPTDYVVGPMGGPMYREWDFKERSKPGDDALEKAMQELKENWVEVVGRDIGKITTPIKFAGDKRRRLVVLAIEKENPPWGTWDSRSHDEAKGREFTIFRSAINAAIAPHEVDHVDFITSLEAANLMAIRLIDVDPLGNEVNAVIVPSLELWVRSFVPDLAAMKRDEKSGFESYLKDGKISPLYRVFKIHGPIIRFKKKYDEGVPEVLMRAEQATDITESAQKVLDRAYALYIEHNMWPEDDNF